MSNMKQLGMAVQMYLGDNDDRLFFRSGKTSSSRLASPVDTSADNSLKWWNQLMPYTKSAALYKCPSDGSPTLSADNSGALTIPRSYVAAASIEFLKASQITDSAKAIVITEKWGLDPDGVAIGESWLEAFDGDMNPDSRKPAVYVMAKFANRHQGGMECAFFDGHAKWEKPEFLVKDPLLNGCSLVHYYPASNPTTNPSAKMCDSSVAGCVTGSNPATGYWNDSPKPNLCNTPAFFPYPQP
jgi:prepilin-type processing-associated H-X9-DG protein